MTTAERAGIGLARLSAGILVAIGLPWVGAAFAQSGEGNGSGVIFFMTAGDIPRLHVAAGGNDQADCGASSRPCATLAHAITVLRGKEGAIEIGPGTFTTTDVEIATNLNIAGAGAGETILDARNEGRALSIRPGARVVIEGLTIQGGQVIGADAGEPGGAGVPARGGGIFNEGYLTLKNAAVTNNRVVGGNGLPGLPGDPNQPGGAGGSGAEATGGGIHSTGPLRILQSEISSNQAIGGNGAAGGNGGHGSPGAKGRGGNGSAGRPAGRGGAGGDALGGGVHALNRLSLEYSTVSANSVEGGQGGNGALGGTGGRGGSGRRNALGTGLFGCKVSRDGGRGGTGGGPGVGGNGGAGGWGRGAGMLTTTEEHVTVLNSYLVRNVALGGAPGGAGSNGGAGGGGAGGPANNPVKGRCVATGNAETGPTGSKGGEAHERPARGAEGRSQGAGAHIIGVWDQSDPAAPRADISGSILSGNVAGIGAGLSFRPTYSAALSDMHPGHMSVANTTFTGNRAEWGGSAILALGRLDLLNSLVWDNTDLTTDKPGHGLQQIWSDYSRIRFGGEMIYPILGEVVPRASCVQDSDSLKNPLPPESLIASCDPDLVDVTGPDGVSGTADDDLTPGLKSSLIDAGLPIAGLPETDIYGNLRVYDHPFHHRSPASGGVGDQTVASGIDVGAVEAVLEPVFWPIGTALAAPDGAMDANGKAFGPPLVEPAQAQAEFAWDKSARVYVAIRRSSAGPVTLTWPTRTPDTSNVDAPPDAGVKTFGRSDWPLDAQQHVMGAPVSVFPPKESSLAFVGIEDPGGPGRVLNGVFHNERAGTHSLLVFTEGADADYERNNTPLRYVAVRTVAAAEIESVSDACSVGTPLLDSRHGGPRNGFLVDPMVPVASGNGDASYDRASQTGPIIPVNATAAVPDHPIRIAWYRRDRNGIDWPDTVVRYDCDWPDNAPELVMTSPEGSGPLAEAGEALPRVYSQPDPSQPGFNPNDEHAWIDTASRGLYALRLEPEGIGGAGQFVLLRRPGGSRPYEVWRLRAQSAEHPLATVGKAVASLEIAPPVPIALAGDAPCRETSVEGFGYRAGDGRVFATASTEGADPIRVRWFYRVRPGFSLAPGQPPADCLPWLALVSGDGQAVASRYAATWPDDVEKVPLGKTVIDPIAGMAAVGLVHGLDLGVHLFQPTEERAVELGGLPPSIRVDAEGHLLDLDGSLYRRVRFSGGRLILTGRIAESTRGTPHPMLSPNVLSSADAAALKALDKSNDPAFAAAISALRALTLSPHNLHADKRTGRGNVLSTITSKRPGHLTLVFNDDATVRAGTPVALKVFEITCPVYSAPVHVLTSRNVFDDRVYLRYGADFGGLADRLGFEWLVNTDASGGRLDLSDGRAPDGWRHVDGSADFAGGFGGEPGMAEIAQGAPGPIALRDFHAMARWAFRDGGPCGDEPSVFSGQTTPVDGAAVQPAFAEGWVKRVLGKVNQFDQRQRNLLNGPEKPDFTVIGLAGPRYENEIALAGDDLTGVGLIAAYQTVLNRARRLSIDNPTIGDTAMALDPASSPDRGDPLLFAASRIASLYRELGDEAFADFSDPTIPVHGQFEGAASRTTNHFAFEGQMASLLDEELALLRGLDNQNPRQDVTTAPTYNRLKWNVVPGAPGTPFYITAYGLRSAETAQEPGRADRNEVANPLDDARAAFPQGHGDAYGHYLTATETFYDLLRHPLFVWRPGVEQVASGVSTVVDFREERQFIRAAAAKAQTAVRVSTTTYRKTFSEDDRERLAGFPDTVMVQTPGVNQSRGRAWGATDWARKAGAGAYLDWVAAGALLPARFCAPGTAAAKAGACDGDADDIRRIDRETTPELGDLVDAHNDAQSFLDRAARGLNPLGLSRNVVPFALNHKEIDFNSNGQFDQVHARTMEQLERMNSLVEVLSRQTRTNYELREKQSELRREIDNREAELRDRAMRIFGSPYTGDIGGSGSYAEGYRGPDIFNHDIIDNNPAEFFGPGFPIGDLFEVEVRPSANIAEVFNSGSKIFREAGWESSDSILSQAVSLVNLPAETAVNHLGTPDSYDQATQLAVNPEIDRTEMFGSSAARPIRTLYATGMRGKVKPDGFGTRAQAGELQILRASLMRELGQLHQSVSEYNALRDTMEAQYEALLDLVEGQALEESIVKGAREKTLFLQSAMIAAKAAASGADWASKKTIEVGKASAEAIPTDITDPGAPARSGIRMGAILGAGILKATSISLELGAVSMELSRSQIESDTQMRLMAGVARNFERRQQAQGLIDAALREPQLRAAVIAQMNGVQEAELRYKQALGEGMRVLEDIIRVRRAMGADVVWLRYADSVNRALRAEALESYNSTIDEAARQVYLLAKAYDYETGRYGNNTREFEDIDAMLAEILRERRLGEFVNGQPVASRGNGLLGVVSTLKTQFERFKRSTIYLSPATRTVALSIRNGLFQMDRPFLDPNADLVEFDRSVGIVENDRLFAERVFASYLPDLRALPEFIDCCLPKWRRTGPPIPGLALRFATRIEPGANLFGNPFGPGDEQPSRNAGSVRIMGASVVTPGFDWEAQNIGRTIEVFLLPVGQDITSASDKAAETTCDMPPLSDIKEINAALRDMRGKRCWTVLDAKDVSAGADGVERRESVSIRAFSEEQFSAENSPFDHQLVGRSLENTGWLLVIPGENLLADGAVGVRRLLGIDADGNATGDGITDIKLVFDTYANSN